MKSSINLSLQHKVEFCDKSIAILEKAARDKLQIKIEYYLCGMLRNYILYTFKVRTKHLNEIFISFPEFYELRPERDNYYGLWWHENDLRSRITFLKELKIKLLTVQTLF